MRANGITNPDLWNMDKTRFWISCEKTQLVVTMEPIKLLRMIDPENHDYITLVEYIGSAGEIIPPMLLISGVNILRKWCLDNNLDDETLIGTTDTRNANDDTVLDWLQYFIDHT